MNIKDEKANILILFPSSWLPHLFIFFPSLWKERMNQLLFTIYLLLNKNQY